MDEGGFAAPKATNRCFFVDFYNFEVMQDNLLC